jgi:hypothetical protein
MKTVGPDSSPPPTPTRNSVSFAHFVSSLVHLLLTFVLLYLAVAAKCSWLSERLSKRYATLR